MFDSRYPFMFRIEDSEIPDVMRAHYKHVAERVLARTGLQTCYRKPTGGLYFYLGDPSRGVWEHPIRFKDTPQPWRKVDIEPLVKCIAGWKASKVTKRKWVAEQERLDEERRLKAQESFYAERRNDAKDHFKKLRTNRRSVLKTGRLGQKAVA